MNIYFHLVVHSYYKQVKSIAPNVTETAPRQLSALSVVKPYTSLPTTPLTQYLLQVPTLPPIHHPPHKKLKNPDSNNRTDNLGSTVSWVETIWTQNAHMCSHLITYVLLYIEEPRRTSDLESVICKILWEPPTLNQALADQRGAR
jgi:hypothetical protein